MANLLQSSQTQSTCAPSYYTNYLSNLATTGTQAQKCAQYVGAQPLQTQAFQNICSKAFQYQPMVSTGQTDLGNAANQNITGAASPYLTAATSASPLCAAKGLINKSSCLNLGNLAQCYMNPYVKCEVQQLNDIGQRNIQMNLAPQATAAAVGSGQFGSQRGAQVLGQVEANAEQCLNAQTSKMLACGYNQALTAAQAKESALGSLANTQEAAQAAQNTIQAQAGQEAANAAAQQASAEQQAGLGEGTLATQGQTMNLGCINAMATLGGQQQTIAQNKQCYPLTTLSKLSSLLSGQNIPTTTKTTLCTSPLSAVATLGATAKGIACSKLSCSLAKLFSPSTANNNNNTSADTVGTTGTSLPTGDGTSATNTPGINYAASCGCCANYSYQARGGLISAKSRGAKGCSSTKNRGALPSKG